MKSEIKMTADNVPFVVIDKNLDKYQNKTMFPKKLEIANKAISKLKLPRLKK